MSKTCDDFPGNCCWSCHDDVGFGYSLIKVYYKNSDEVYARVCCSVHDKILKLRDNYPEADFSFYDKFLMDKSK